MRHYFFPNDITRITCLIISVLMSMGAFMTLEARQNGDPLQQSSRSPVTGRWVRSDGGYFLDLKYSEKEGKFSAAYYNPAPINVSQARCRQDNGTFNILVELRDINYPGSTYALRYDAGDDRLKGTYFQAVDKITYEIEFFRATRR